MTDEDFERQLREIYAEPPDFKKYRDAIVDYSFEITNDWSRCSGFGEALDELIEEYFGKEINQ